MTETAPAGPTQPEPWPEPLNPYQRAGIDHDRYRGEQIDQVYDDMSDPLASLEANVANIRTTLGLPGWVWPPVEPEPEPDPIDPRLLFPMVGHMPFDADMDRDGDVDRVDQVQSFRSQQDRGLVSYWFMYYGPGKIPSFDQAWEMLGQDWEDGRRFGVIVSPKEIAAAGGLAGVYERLPEAMCPWVQPAYFQEAPNDFGVPGKPPFTAYHQGVRECADVAHAYGAPNLIHGQTGWDLSPYNGTPGRGEAYLDQLYGPIADMVDGISESLFTFTGGDSLDDLVRYAVPYLESRFPGRRIMFTSTGAPSKGAPTPESIARLIVAGEHGYQQAVDLGHGTAWGHYSVGHEKDRTYYGPDGETVDNGRISAYMAGIATRLWTPA